MVTLGERLKKTRSDHNIKQEDLAGMLGVSRQSISAWENDKFLPDILSVIRLSEIYDISLDELLKDKDVYSQLNSDIRYWQNGDYFCSVYLNDEFIKGSDYSYPTNPYMNVIRFEDTGFNIVKCYYTSTSRNEISNPLYLKYKDISYMRLLVLRRIVHTPRSKLLPHFHYKFMLQIHLKEDLYLNLELNPVYEMKNVFNHLAHHVPFDDPFNILEMMKDENTFYGENYPENSSFPFREHPDAGFEGWANEHFDEWKNSFNLPDVTFDYDSINHEMDTPAFDISNAKSTPLNEEEKKRLFGNTPILLKVLIVFWIIVIVLMMIHQWIG